MSINSLLSQFDFFSIVVIIALALIIGFNLHETNLIDNDIYATTSESVTSSNEGDADSGLILNNTDSNDLPSDLSSSFLNSSVAGTVMSESNVQNNTNVDNSTSPPVTINASSGPQPGSLQIPYTGLSRYHVTPENAKLFGLDESSYAMIVTEVEPRSPAAVAGIRGGNITTNVAGDTIKLGGDMILSVDGNDTFIRTNEAFLNYLRNEKKVGENMSLAVLRDGKVSDVQMTIGAIPKYFWYEDNDEGIRIKYPFDWEVSGSESITDIVKFVSPQNIRVGNDTEPAAGIFLLTTQAGDRSLDDLATAELEDTRVNRNLGITLTNFANLPGYESVFYDYSDENRILKKLSIFTVKDGDLYRINFATDPSRYDDYLPLAREVIKSFQFTK